MRFPPLILSLLFLTISYESYGSGAGAVILPDDLVQLPPPMRNLLKNWNGSRSWMKKGEFVIADTETTGIARHDRIVQVTLYKMRDGCFTGHTYNSYFNPGRPSSYRARNAHKLGDSFLKTQPKFEDEFDKIKAFIGDNIVVGHNISFDARMFCQEYERLDGEGEWTFYTKCTYRMMQRHDKRQEALQDITNSLDPSLIISPPPKKVTSRRLSRRERQRRDREREDQKIAREWAKERRVVESSRDSSSQEEARAERAERRAEQRDAEHNQLKRSRDDQSGDEENAPPPLNEGDQRAVKKIKSYKLGDVVERIGTNPFWAVQHHGHDLIDLAEEAGVPEARRGVYHDAFTDVAGNLGLTDYLSSSSASSPSQESDEDISLSPLVLLRVGI